MNEQNYRNKRFNSKRSNQHNFNSKTNSMFARFIGYFKLRFRKQKVNKVTNPPKTIRNIFKKRPNRNYSPMHKSTNCAIKQFANMKKLHSNLWNGSNPVELV